MGNARKYAAAGCDRAFLVVVLFGKELWIIGWCTIFFPLYYKSDWVVVLYSSDVEYMCLCVCQGVVQSGSSDTILTPCQQVVF